MLHFITPFVHLEVLLEQSREVEVIEVEEEVHEWTTQIGKHPRGCHLDLKSLIEFTMNLTFVRQPITSFQFDFVHGGHVEAFGLPQE